MCIGDTTQSPTSECLCLVHFICAYCSRTPPQNFIFSCPISKKGVCVRYFALTNHQPPTNQLTRKGIKQCRHLLQLACNDSQPGRCSQRGKCGDASERRFKYQRENRGRQGAALDGALFFFYNSTLTPWELAAGYTGRAEIPQFLPQVDGDGARQSAALRMGSG